MLDSEPSFLIATVAIQPENLFKSIHRGSICAVADSMYIYLKSGTIPLDQLAKDPELMC